MELTKEQFETKLREAFRAGRDYEDVYGFAEDEVEFVNNEDEWIKNYTKEDLK